MPHRPEVTWYGTDDHRIQTIYTPGSFTPLLRVETELAELAKTAHRTLAEKLQQDAGMTFVPELVAMLNRLEHELRRSEISEANQQWLAQCGLNPAKLAGLVEPEYVPESKNHLYYCDHWGLQLVLVSEEGKTAWRAEYDEWGNMLWEDNPGNLEQLIRLPGQQEDRTRGRMEASI